MVDWPCGKLLERESKGGEEHDRIGVIGNWEFLRRSSPLAASFVQSFLCASLRNSHSGDRRHKVNSFASFFFSLSYNLTLSLFRLILFFLMDAAQLSRWTRFASKGGIGKCIALQDCVAREPDDLMFLKVHLSLPLLPSFLAQPGPL